MVQCQFSLSWDAYKSSICGGFSSLQQNGEFVDMTLAADGHFVKVHQVLMALVSPYLKDLISSAPCQHPVIFLNNVSYKTLTSLLEYVYTGEALIHSDNLSAFVQAAKSLHIKGLEELNSTDNMSFKMVDHTSQLESSELCHVTGLKKMTLPSDVGNAQINLPAAAKKITIKNEKISTTPTKAKRLRQEEPDDSHDFDMMDDSGAQHSDTQHSDDDGADAAQTAILDKEKATTNLQYSVSIRGSLQVVLNRYIYNIQSTQTRTGLRRWRCIEYRNNRCKAFLVTKGNVVTNRSNLHNHSFHDKKILQKIEKKAIFSTIDDVQGYQEKEFDKDTDNEASMEQQDVTIGFTENVSDELKRKLSKNI